MTEGEWEDRRQKLLKEIYQLIKSEPLIEHREEAFYQTEAWRRARYFAMINAKGCCEACGSRKRPFHIDHIKPRSKYPELELDPNNLQVLCVDCNVGKGNWDETDWRNQ